MAGIIEEKRSALGIRLLMANLPIMVCDLLRSAFAQVPDIQIVEPINDVQQLLDISKKGTADIILLGSSRVENIFSAVAIIDALPECYKDAKVIVLTQRPGYAEVISLFRAGVRGIFCSSNLQFNMLCKSIRRVHEGQIWASNEQLGHLVSSVSRPKSTDVTDSHGRPLLTTREQQVLHLLADGMSNHELATMLRLSEHTVKNHLFRIYDKLGVSNRMEAVLYALTPRNTLPAPVAPTSKVASSKIRMIKTG
ncbi:response regulator transcription factor [Granulicella arctica]|uniref:DNA-binding NarL/FixJ family response regulator n=1 Tax=Granulicella arctica TaxID=940613 RepID=A0A7Y9PH47_9BACT|nr:response regulator transcription factor [Granulicella arctica]NYF79620.1 DNA-binding NarL/FixJ family response regulator [Granulicella arctica]